MKYKIKAFTLIEMVIAIGILGILLAISIHSFFGVSTFKAERQLTTMEHELEWLRTTALKERVPTSLSIEKGYYCLYVNHEKQESIPLEKDLEFLHGKYGGNFGDQLAFSSSGRPSNAGTMYFRIKKTTKALVLSPVNGHVSIREVEE